MICGIPTPLAIIILALAGYDAVMLLALAWVAISDMISEWRYHR